VNASRIDIVGGILAAHPKAVVAQRQFDGGFHYDVRLPGRTHNVRMSVEWGDNEAAALAHILARLAGPDTWNGR
jgi:hypothetical protein